MWPKAPIYELAHHLKCMGCIGFLAQNMWLLW